EAVTSVDGTFTALGDGLFEPFLRLAATQTIFAGLTSADLAGLGFSISTTSTDSTTDLVDVNGDGVVEAVGPGFSNLDGSLRQRSGYSYGVGSDVPIPQTTSGGRALSMETGTPQSFSPSLTASVGLTIGRNATTQDLIDMNGDGLPDQVRRVDFNGRNEIQV